MQGQELGLADHSLQSVLHVGVDHHHGVDLVRVIPLQQQLGDLTGAAQGGVLRRVEKALLDGDVPLGEPAAAILTHHIEVRVRVVGHELLGLADGVLIIRAGKALIRGDEQAGRTQRHFLDRKLRRLKVTALHGGVRVEHTADLGLQRIKVGTGVAQLLLCLAQLGLGDEVHGVGDLLGLPDASDAPADLTGAGHTLTARLHAGSAPAWCLQSR